MPKKAVVDMIEQDYSNFINLYYKSLLELYFQVSEAIRGVNFTSELELDHFRGYLAKLFFHALSALQLSKGVEIPIESVKIDIPVLYDPITIKIIARATLETYASFYHIFIAPQDDDTREFRLCYSAYRGLLTRKHARPQNEAHIKKMIKEDNEREALLNRIKVTKKYQTLKTGPQST